VSERYEIKPLEWQEERYAHRQMRPIFTARTPVAQMFLELQKNGVWWFSWYTSNEHGVDKFLGSDDDAKARAQAWYESRLLPALVRVEGP
jgi:hypothetical protein